MGRALGIGLTLAPFISALLLGLGRAGRALHTRLNRKGTPMTQPYRILLTGSRDWPDSDAVDAALADTVRTIPADQEVVIVHGDCPTGTDRIAHAWGVQYGAIIEAHPAPWRQHGRAAGPIRNAEMVALGADICLAFIKDGSRGASHTVALAEQAGIPVRKWTA